MNTVYTIKKYGQEHYGIWNDFISNAKNATFLFHRDFMAYHSDRFEDFSLLIFKNDSLISVFPANVIDHSLHSHQGLSYGSFVFDRNIKFRDGLQAVKHTLQYCAERHIKTIHLKLIPKIYHRIPSGEIDYLLFLLDARLTRRDLSSTVVMADSSFAANRMEGIRRGQKNKLTVSETNDFAAFWNALLIPKLRDKFQKRPVHSLDEIRYLKQKFPGNIRQFNVYKNDMIVAGTTVFESHQVAHAQYIASNSGKNQLGSLDFLHHHLITKVFSTKKYYDFGISNENEGRHINEGLLYWKQGYGSGTVPHDFYTIDTEKYVQLNTVFI